MITAASTAASAAGERSVAARNAAWIARDAPRFAADVDPTGCGPTARPRATAWRMFSIRILGEGNIGRIADGQHPGAVDRRSG